jgi:predicted nucleic acid-binding Zn ribbon protein
MTLLRCGTAALRPLPTRRKRAAVTQIGAALRLAPPGVESSPPMSAPKSLRELTDDELNQRLAEAGRNVNYSVNDYRNESSRRELAATAKHAKQAADRASWTALVSCFAAAVSAIAAVVAVVLSLTIKPPTCSLVLPSPSSVAPTHAP